MLRWSWHDGLHDDNLLSDLDGLSHFLLRWKSHSHQRVHSHHRVHSHQRVLSHQKVLSTWLDYIPKLITFIMSMRCQCLASGIISYLVSTVCSNYSLLCSLYWPPQTLYIVITQGSSKDLMLESVFTVQATYKITPMKGHLMIRNICSEHWASLPCYLASGKGHLVCIVRIFILAYFWLSLCREPVVR